MHTKEKERSDRNETSHGANKQKDANRETETENSGGRNGSKSGGTADSSNSDGRDEAKRKTESETFDGFGGSKTDGTNGGTKENEDTKKDSRNDGTKERKETKPDGNDASGGDSDFDAKDSAEKGLEKPFRFRPAVGIAVGAVAGVLAAYAGFALDAPWFCGILFAAAGILLAVIFRKKKRFLYAVVVAAAVFASATGAFVRNTPFAMDGVADVEGNVAAVDRNRTTLTNVTINGIAVEQKLLLTLLYDEGLELSDRVAFRAKVESIDGRENGYNLSNIAKGIGFASTAKALTSKSRGNPNFFQKIRLRLKSSLLETMSPDDAGVALSLLLGDKELLSDTDDSAVTMSGTAHIFAVSGLHVGFLVGALVWILKKLKTNRCLSMGIVTAVLLFYGVLCGFPASFNRAAVMSLALFAAPLVYRRYDALSALAFSMAAILLVQPLSLFTAGFQLSFAALAGITFLYRPVKAAVKRAVRFDWLSASVALSIASTVGIYPVAALYFGTFSTYFILSNLLVVPLVAVTYLLLLSASVFVVFAPAALSFMFYPGYGFVRAISAVTAFFGSLPGSLIAVPSLGLGMFGYYGSFALMSPYCLLSKKSRTYAVAGAAVAAVALFALSAALAALAG